MNTLSSKIESLLFITNQPLSFKRLAELVKAEKDEVASAVEELMAEYNSKSRGVQIQKIGDKVQMVTVGDNAKLVKDFIKEETTGELTRAALETLTIVAYRGPITRAELEQIRGVNCAVILRHLLIRGLVESIENKKKMQTTYNVTFDFLRFLGMNQPSELPDYEKLNSSESLQRMLEAAKQATPAQ